MSNQFCAAVFYRLALVMRQHCLRLAGSGSKRRSESEQEYNSPQLSKH
jgi:hypothetical protein